MDTFIIANRYTTSIKLGHGGFADVFLAFDPITNREVAIKYLKHVSKEINDDEYLKYKQEVTIMASLSNENIVKVYDTGIHEGHPYVVMEYVKGNSLKEIIYDNGYLLVEEINNYLMQMLNGLEAMHSLGIIHRDIKPENIIITSSNTLKLLDFGTAYLLNTKYNSFNGEAGQVTGTMHYLAPEYTDCPKGSILSDIYATGIVMFEMFAGKPPFTSLTDDIKEIFRKHVRMPLPNINKFNPNCPSYYKKIIEKATAKKPRKRYQSVYELKKDLQLAYLKYKKEH